MIRKIAIMAALCALAAIALASSASAATYVRSGSSTGPTYTGNISAAQSGTSTLQATDSSGTTVSCSGGQFTGSVGASGGASVSGTLTTLDFGPGCSSNTFPAIDNCHLNSAGPVSATASSTGGTMTINPPSGGGNSISETCYTSGGLAVCTFTRTTAFSGTVANSDNSVTFTNVAVASTNFGCPATAAFNGKFRPIQTDDGNPPVTLWLTTA